MTSLSPNFLAVPWDNFQDNPFSGIHTDYLVDSLLPLRILDEKVFRSALEEQHGRALLIQLLQRQYSLHPLSDLNPQPVDAALMALSVQDWIGAAGACGAIYWSRKLFREVRAPILRQLLDEFGASWWRWVELGLIASNENESFPCIDMTTPWDVEEWRCQIMDVGWELLWSWRDSLDESLSAWVKLKENSGNSFQREPVQFETDLGVRLVRRFGAALQQHLMETK